MITKEQLEREVEYLMTQQGYVYKVNWLEENIKEHLYNLMISCHAEGYRKGMEDMRELPF